MSSVFIAEFSCCVCDTIMHHRLCGRTATPGEGGGGPTSGPSAASGQSGRLFRSANGLLSTIYDI